MMCNNCGNNIKDNQKFCNMCGVKITHEITEEQYIEEFIGNTDDEKFNDRFNIYVLAEGAFYFMYRKLYLQAFIIFTFEMFFYRYFLLINIPFAFLFNRKYLEYARKKVNKILDKYSDKEEDFILEKIQKKGGAEVSVFLEVMFLIVVIALFTTAYMEGAITFE